MTIGDRENGFSKTGHRSTSAVNLLRELAMIRDKKDRFDEQQATVIDFEAAAQRITSDRIAAALSRLAGKENIRVIEALASAIANSLKSEGDFDQPFAYERVQLLRHSRNLYGEDQTKIAAIRRIARRALCETLCDPTRGSNAFHRVEISPDWSKDILPVAVFGPFLFYRL